MHPFPLPWPESAEASRFWQCLRSSPRSVLMLDYDGTLAPFKKDRLQAYPYSGVSDRLAMLSRLPRVRLVLVSGRPARELLGFFPSLEKVEIWGSHGEERLRGDASYELLPIDDEQRRFLGRVKEEVETMGYGEAIEEKPVSLAVHWRDLDPSTQEKIRAGVQSLYARLDAPGKPQLLSFDGGLEFRFGRRNKGTAVREILTEEDPGIPLAYLGDDLTDEDAFAAVGSRGLSILVGAEARESCARFWIRPPDQVLQFLDNWIEVVQAEALPNRSSQRSSGQRSAEKRS